MIGAQGQENTHLDLHDDVNFVIDKLDDLRTSLMVVRAGVDIPLMLIVIHDTYVI